MKLLRIRALQIQLKQCHKIGTFCCNFHRGNESVGFSVGDGFLAAQVVKMGSGLLLAVAAPKGEQQEQNGNQTEISFQTGSTSVSKAGKLTVKVVP